MASGQRGPGPAEAPCSAGSASATPPPLGVEILLQSGPPPTALRPLRDFVSQSQQLTLLYADG